MGKPRPRNGPSSTQPGSKAGKLPKFRKQKKQQQPDGEDKDREPRKTRSVWGLAGLFIGLASLLTYAVGTQRKQKRIRDRHILAGMLRRPLVYTEHAACRMECRFIGKAEVLEAITNGSINERKSRPRLRPCPKYVVDASVGPHSKNVQAVFSACPAATNVVTVIDRDTNWACPPC